MAKSLARRVGYKYIDSGAMYRAVTLYAMTHDMIADNGTIDINALKNALPDIKINFSIDHATGKNTTMLNGENVESRIRSMEISNHVSPIATVPEVREALTAKMKEIGSEKGVVMDGRDIGTSVFPDAEMKVFVDASAEVRAQRRYKELKGTKQEDSYEAILKNVKERDYIDSHRQVSPLRKADDAAVLCNDNMSIEEQEEWLLSLFNAKAGL